MKTRLQKISKALLYPPGGDRLDARPRGISGATITSWDGPPEVNLEALFSGQVTTSVTGANCQAVPPASLASTETSKVELVAFYLLGKIFDHRDRLNFGTPIHSTIAPGSELPDISDYRPVVAISVTSPISPLHDRRHDHSNRQSCAAAYSDLSYAHKSAERNERQMVMVGFLQAQKHHARERLAAPRCPQRFHLGRLLPEDRPGAGGRKVPACVLRRPACDARYLWRQPGRGRRERCPGGQDRPRRNHDGHGLLARNILASDRPPPPPTMNHSTSPAGSRPSTICWAAARRGTS